MTPSVAATATTRAPRAATPSAPERRAPRSAWTIKVSYPALRWMIVAGLIRFIVAIAVHSISIYNGNGGFIPGYDDIYYWDVAVARYNGQTDSFGPGFYAAVLSTFFLFTGGPDVLMGKLLNVVAGTLTVGIGVLLIEELTRARASKRIRRRSANWAGFFLTFYPSMLWYSTQLLKDPLLILFGITALYCQVCFLRQARPASIIGWLLSSLGLFLFRPYAAVALALGLMVFVLRFNRKWLLPTLALVSVVPYALGMGWFGWKYVQPMLDVERISYVRQTVYSIGGSAAGITVDYSNPLSFALTYSYSLATAMFGPFPWQVKSLGQAVALPEAMVTWLLFPLWLRSLRDLVRRKSSADTAATRDSMIFIFSLVLIAIIAIFSDNIGANTRLRLLPWGAFFLFASLTLARKRFKFF